MYSNSWKAKQTDTQNSRKRVLADSRIGKERAIGNRKGLIHPDAAGDQGQWRRIACGTGKRTVGLIDICQLVWYKRGYRIRDPRI
jgi:hypothetical protein